LIPEAFAFGLESGSLLFRHWRYGRRYWPFGLVRHISPTSALGWLLSLPAGGQHPPARSYEQCSIQGWTDLCPVAVDRFPDQVGFVGPQEIPNG